MLAISHLRIGIGIVLVVSNIAAANASEQSLNVTECDKQAASPVDEMRPRSIAGVEFYAIQNPSAARACLAALKTDPTNARLWFQLARSLDAMKLYESAYQAYCRAALHGSAAAMNNLAILYEHGRGVEQNVTLAKSWFDRGAELGNKIAILNAANAFDVYGTGRNDGKKSVYWHLMAIADGSSEAKEALLSLSERSEHTREAFQSLLKENFIYDGIIDDLPKNELLSLTEKLLSKLTSKK